MITYPNQKVVIMGKRQSFDTENKFSRRHIEAEQLAARTLKHTGLKLWMYLSGYQEKDKYGKSVEIALSPKDVAEKYNLRDKSYDNAVKELIEKNYLVQTQEGSNHYIFYEYPYC